MHPRRAALLLSAMLRSSDKSMAKQFPLSAIVNDAAERCRYQKPRFNMVWSHIQRQVWSLTPSLLRRHNLAPFISDAVVQIWLGVMAPVGYSSLRPGSFLHFVFLYIYIWIPLAYLFKKKKKNPSFLKSLTPSHSSSPPSSTDSGTYSRINAVVLNNTALRLVH